MLFDPAAHGWPLDLARYRRQVRAARALAAWFRPVYSGFEVFRRPGPLLVAANHGLFALEFPSMMAGVWDAAQRPIRGLGDRILYATRLQRALLGRTGGVEGTPANAQALLDRGDAVYVCPGGAREALASARDRYKLLWDGHTGYVRAAIRGGAPIVPLAVIGIDEVYRQLIDAEGMRETALGRLVVRLLGAKYVPPLYVGLGPLPFPLRLRFLAGTPIEVPADRTAADDVRVVDRLHRATVHALEALIARGLAEREREERALPPGVERAVTRALRRLAGPLVAPPSPAEATNGNSPSEVNPPDAAMDTA
jgi:1-acyl-sn-glycerol-3-phosphate acyltransferase